MGTPSGVAIVRHANLLSDGALHRLMRNIVTYASKGRARAISLHISNELSKQMRIAIYAVSWFTQLSISWCYGNKIPQCHTNTFVGLSGKTKDKHPVQADKTWEPGIIPTSRP